MSNFELIKKIIEERRNINPADFNDKKISDDDINSILSLANWAPTHGRTEPWRILVLAGNACANFGKTHADLYKENTPEEKFLQDTYIKFENQGIKSSHVLIVYSKRGKNPNIPEWEELAATSAAVQNMLLGAEALGIAAFWSTGGQITKPSLKKYFELTDEENIIGVIYLGYSDKQLTGKRNTPIEDKIQWIKN